MVKSIEDIGTIKVRHVVLVNFKGSKNLNPCRKPIKASNTTQFEHLNTEEESL